MLNLYHSLGTKHFIFSSFFFFFFFFFCFFVFVIFFWLHLWHMGGSRLGGKLVLWLPAFTIATATPDLSYVCNLHHRSRQCRILNLVSKARNQTYVLMDTSQIRYHWATTVTPFSVLFNKPVTFRFLFSHFLRWGNWGSKCLVTFPWVHNW